MSSEQINRLLKAMQEGKIKEAYQYYTKLYPALSPTTKAEEKTETKTEIEPMPYPEPMPSPEPMTQPQPYPEPIPEPMPMPMPMPTPLPETKPITEITEEIPEKTRIKIPPIIRPDDDKEDKKKEIVNNPPKGTVCWIQGRPEYKDGTIAPMFKVITPPYSQEDMFSTRVLPKGYVDEGFEGEGSAFKSIQVIGGKPDNDIRDVDLGFVKINIGFEGEKPVISYVSDEDANVGTQKYQTIGFGANQIPVDVWRKAKAQGLSKEQVAQQLLEQEGNQASKKQKALEELYSEDDLLMPGNNREWYEYTNIENPVKNNKKVAYNSGESYYRGRPILPADLGVNI
jgi:hypothetical protein